MIDSGACRTYDLGGHLLSVWFPHGKAIEAFDHLIGEFHVSSSEEPGYFLTINERPLSAVPPGAELIYAGPTSNIEDCTYHEVSDAYLVRFADQASVLMMKDRSRASIEVASDGYGAAFGTSLVTALEAALDAMGQIMVHTAGLIPPGGQSVVLLHAASGVGKTTTTLRLASQGYGICADDTMVLHTEEEAIRCWGLMGNFKVHRRTARMLPWLLPMLGPDWNCEDEQAIPRETIAGSVRLEEPASRPIASIVHLVRDEAGATSIQPMSKVDALAELTLDNVRASKTGLLPMHQRRFDALARLAVSVPTFRATLGPDTSGLGTLLAACVRPITAGRRD